MEALWFCDYFLLYFCAFFMHFKCVFDEGTLKNSVFLYLAGTFPVFPMCDPTCERKNNRKLWNTQRLFGNPAYATGFVGRNGNKLWGDVTWRLTFSGALWCGPSCSGCPVNTARSRPARRTVSSLAAGQRRHPWDPLSSQVTVFQLPRALNFHALLL